jgi:hypothetical protein
MLPASCREHLLPKWHYSPRLGMRALYRLLQAGGGFARSFH